jgi:hypothetical protein
MGAVMTLFILVGVLGVSAHSEPIDSGSASAGGWHVTVPGVTGATLTPSVTATYPCASPPCQSSQNLANVVVGNPLAPVASANALHAEAQAFRDANAAATLQTIMSAASAAAGGPSLPSAWNTHGYSSATGVSFLAGRVTASFIEAEAVSAGLNGSLVSASGARVVDLQILGFAPGVALAPILPNTPNQTLLDAGGVLIKYWETNWDPKTGTTTDGQPIYVNALRITEAATGIDIKVAVASTQSQRVPVALDDSASTAPATPVVIDVDANDSDEDGNLRRDQVTITQQPANGTVTCNNQSDCTYTPKAGFVGTDTFTYEICDWTGLCDTATVTVTVTADTGTGDTGTGDTGTGDTGTGDTGTGDTGTGDTGTGDTGTGDTGTGGPANQAPDAVDDSASTNGNASVTINVVANDSDPDGNLVRESAAVTQQPANGVVVCGNGSCTYTPNAGFSGSDSFQYQVCDFQDLCDTATVTVTVPGPNNNTGGGGTGGDNRPPVATDDSASTDGGTSVTIEVTPNDTDPDGNLVREAVGITVPPQHGAVICSGGSCTYTPDPGYTGPDSFEYRVCDWQNACDTATVQIVVGDQNGGGVNEPPVAGNDSVTAQPGQPVTIDVTNNDGDPDGDLALTTVTVTVPPKHGSVTCTEGKCTYTPELGFTGHDSFEYRVCDALGACTTAVVTVTVPSPQPNVGDADGGLDGPDGDAPGEGDAGDGTGEDGIGEDENGGDGNGGDNGGGSDGESGDDRDPALPGDAAPNAPINLDNPLLGAPNGPLPLTGGEPSFYVGAALNLLLIGMLLLAIERFTRASRMSKPCPAWHNHQEAHDAKSCAYGEWS